MILKSIPLSQLLAKFREIQVKCVSVSQKAPYSLLCTTFDQGLWSNVKGIGCHLGRQLRPSHLFFMRRTSLLRVTSSVCTGGLCMDREPGDAAITRPWGRPDEVGERSWYAGISPVAARGHRQNTRVHFNSTSFNQVYHLHRQTGHQNWK